MSTSFSLNNVFKRDYHICFNIRLTSSKTLIASKSPFSAFSRMVCNLSLILFSRISSVAINLSTSIVFKLTLLQNINQFELISIFHLIYYGLCFLCIRQPKRCRLPFIYNFCYYFKSLLIEPPTFSVATSLY